MVPLGVQDVDLAPAPVNLGWVWNLGHSLGRGIFFPGTRGGELGLLHLPEWRRALPGAGPDPGGGGALLARLGRPSPCSPLAFPSCLVPAPARLQMPFLQEE